MGQILPDGVQAFGTCLVLGMIFMIRHYLLYGLW